MEEQMTTDLAHSPAIPPEVVISLELVADENESDVALINAVGHDVVTALQSDGYTVRPLYTGQKGGFLVEIVAVISQMATGAWDNRAVAEEIITDLSGLVTIFGAALPALKKMIHAHKQQVGKEESTARPMKITVELDGVPIVIETSDIASADAALQLALKYRSAHPAAADQVTTKSKVKVQGQIPARKRRPRR